MGQKVNRISQANTAKLSVWLGANREDLHNLEAAAIRKMAAAATGVDASEVTIRALAKAVGVRYARSHYGSGIPGDTTRVVARVLRALLVKLGEPVPDELIAVCNGALRKYIAEHKSVE